LISTSSGIEAIQLGQSVKTDLAILDLNITDMSGLGVLRELRRLSTEPIIVISSSKEEAEVVKCLEMGADEHIPQPFRQLEFVSHVKALLRRQREYSNTKEPAKARG
jgi:DNA-binding response OmpR family regulator